MVESLSRLGRSTKNLIELMELFNDKGVNLVSLKENIDTTTPTGKLLFTLISVISQFGAHKGRIGGCQSKGTQWRQIEKAFFNN